MAILNPSFETAGANPGQALNWTEAQSASGEDVAIFEAGTPAEADPFEDYERQWTEPEGIGNNEISIDEFDPTDLDVALFEGGAAEYDSFEASWKEPAAGGAAPFNNLSLIEFNPGDLDVAQFDTAADDWEDFEEHWTEPEGIGNQTDHRAYTDAPGGGTATSDAATFDAAGVPEDFEDFEDDWDATAEMEPLTEDCASWDVAGVNGFESFEINWVSQMHW